MEHEIAHVDNLLTVAAKHDLEAKVIATYSRARAEGHEPMIASSIAQSKWDL